MQLDAIARYRRSPNKYLHSIHEEFTEVGDELERRVDVEMIIPAPANLPLDELLFVALTPRKNVDFDLQASHLGGAVLKRLDHIDHIIVSQELISTRFLLLVDSIYWPTKAAHSAEAEQHLTDPLLSTAELGRTLQRLMEIPKLTPQQGLQEIALLFDDNAKLRALDSENIDFDAMADLYKLCVVLATRWLAIIRIPVQNQVDRLHFSYSYRRPFDERYPNVTSYVRKWMNGAPPELKIHLPLARISKTYTAAINAPKGFYFNDNALVTDSARRPSRTAAKRIWGSTRSEREMSRLDESKYIKSEPTPTRSQILLTDGHVQQGRLYLYLRMFEIPPGTHLHAALFLTIFPLALLWPMHFVLMRTDPIPDYTELVLGVGTLIASLVITLHPLVQVERPAVLPKIMGIVQLLAMASFLFWLLTEPNRPYPKRADESIDTLQVASNTWFGAAIILLLLSCATFVWRRTWNLVSDSRRVSEVINSRQQGW